MNIKINLFLGEKLANCRDSYGITALSIVAKNCTSQQTIDNYNKMAVILIKSGASLGSSPAFCPNEIR